MAYCEQMQLYLATNADRVHAVFFSTCKAQMYLLIIRSFRCAQETHGHKLGRALFTGQEPFGACSIGDLAVLQLQCQVAEEFEEKYYRVHG